CAYYYGSTYWYFAVW
nr:immunoglobulin heavy chain junction region [Mus musculus]MBK4198092.1 immunoglobulin heavy chain junction region [Mus musculus]MBK4198093.1 immunoglobulin heavy chain junction region [Mus musculus]MBK4198094.1 immunoglobulin heavy chain junction region [Mus musculus]MBK4198095.1 immunoglobulin heavy chain junction region [Mus musculus]